MGGLKINFFSTAKTDSDESASTVSDTSGMRLVGCGIQSRLAVKRGWPIPGDRVMALPMRRTKFSFSSSGARLQIAPALK
jgi:hypothetical protein